MMKDSSEFLPDLGAYYLAAHGGKEVHFCGDFTLRAISWHGDECRSIAGACRVDGLDYVASFDVSRKLWREFSRLLEASLYLECDHVSTLGKVIIRPFEPGLPVWIDLLGSPEAAAESETTGETFVPIRVKNVFGARIVPNSEVLQKRYEWYLKLSTEILGAFGEDATTVRQLIHHGVPCVGQFETEEFHRNLVACFLIRLSIGGDPIEEALDFMVGRQSGIEFSNIQKLISSLMAIREGNVSDNKGVLVSGFMSLLIWHLAMKICAGAPSPSIEGDLIIEWGPDQDDAIELVNMARYCLARTEQPALRVDQIEEEILQIEANDDQVSAMIKARLADYPDAVWKHPELSKVVNAYVRYAVLVQLSEDGGGNVVTDEILTRCKQNVANIADWWYMFTPSEQKLFPLA